MNILVISWFRTLNTILPKNLSTHILGHTYPYFYCVYIYTKDQKYKYVKCMAPTFIGISSFPK